jgi:polygalacturonase
MKRFNSTVARNPVSSPATHSSRLAWLLLLVACDPPGKDSQVHYASDIPVRVGTITQDDNLPPEPSLPTDDQVCAVLEASNAYVKRPDGALPPEADKSPAGVAVAADPAVVNPDQARLQAALDACGVAVDAEVGAAIAAADTAAMAAQKAAGATILSGASAEELAKPQYRASKFAVRLVTNGNGPGNAFISGPLILPSGVTLWIDRGVTLFATRDVMPYLPAGKYCANTAVGPTSAGSSSNCNPLIGGKYMVNSAVMGDGSIDSRAYAEIITSDALYPLMKVDLTCSNTYAAYKNGEKAVDGTPCDDGGTIVNSQSSARNMTWWDLAWLGNMVENGRTGYGSQSNFRMMVFDWAKNLTLYRITMNNSANFHFVPAGVDGLTVWNIKLQTPTLAAYANPAGNYNPLYTGALFNEDNVKNTDAIDPASQVSWSMVPPSTGSKTTATGGAVMFDGYLKNVAIVYNFISTGDDDIVLKGIRNPNPDSGKPGVDGNRDVASNRRWGIIIAHNHIYWGHGISIGSETNSGVANVHVYDNSFNGSEEALRIKSDYARGGEVSNIHYDHICARGILNALLFTTYYSTKAIPSGGPAFPNFHDITLSDMFIEGESNVRLEGFKENSGGYTVPAHPLVMSLTNVVAASPDDIKVVSSDANLTLSGVNLPIFASGDNKVVVTGQATRAVDPALIVNCSQAYVDFPSATSPFGTGWP